MDLPLLFTVISILIILYIGTAIYLHSFAHPEKTEIGKRPSVSVLVAMRNEEDHISACLDSLQAQTYPEDAYRVLIIDDQSIDASAEIAQSFTETYSHFHLLSVAEERYGLKGKMNALASGLEQTDAEIILITDADCIVPPGWIETFVSYFSNDTGLVAAMTLLYPPKDFNLPKHAFSVFQKIQALDWLFLQMFAAFTSHAGKPVTVLGNNFGFRKEAYDAVGGFKKIGFSITEDYALMREIERQGSWQIRHTLDPGNTIFSVPLRSFLSFYRQRKRWVTGGRTARPWGYYLMLLPTLLHLLLPVSLFTSGWIFLKILCWAGIVGTDLVILNRALKRFQLTKLRPYVILFEGFYFLYTVFFALTAFIPNRVLWKERSF